ncbi:unnamed protein product, partial [Iphiclides podalirius]
MSEDNPQDPKNVKMRCLPCVMPYTEDVGNLVQSGNRQAKPQQKQCHGNVQDHSGCQCTPERPCCNYEDGEQQSTGQS